MSDLTLARRRLASARLAGNKLADVSSVVQWFGAMQSQDYGPAKWSIGQRTAGLRDIDVDQALNAGVILRTHVLRPTWHFVLPVDIRWLLELTGPRVHAQNAHYYRQLGLDEAEFARARKLLAGVLQGGNHLTRKEVRALFEGEGIGTEGFRLAYLMMNAELDGVVCSGPLRGRQHTFALLAERAPDAIERSRDEALAELVRRYFTSHGPATVKDLRWWSSVPLADIAQGLEMVGSQLHSERVDGLTFWSASAASPPEPPSPRVQLLQAYDEYFVGVSESRHLGDIAGHYAARSPGQSSANGVVIVDSQLAGHWRRTVKPRSVLVEAELYTAFDEGQAAALQVAADEHGEFLGVPAMVQTSLLQNS